LKTAIGILVVFWLALQLLPAGAHAADEPPPAFYFADSTGQYSLHTLQAHPEWFAPIAEKPWLGRVHTHWYRLQLHNPSDQPLQGVVSTGVANPPLLNAYWVREPDQVVALQPGAGVTATHYARHTNVSLGLQLEPGERGTLYIQYRSLANFPLSLRWVDETTYLERSYVFTLLNGVSLGLGLVLLLFFVVQFLLRPSAALGFYCLFIFCLLLFMVQIFGYGWRLFFPAQTAINLHITALAAAFIYVFYFLFIAKIFPFRRQNPVLYRSLIGCSLAMAALALMGLFGSTEVAQTLLVVVGLPLSVYAAAQAVRRREPGSALLLLGSCLHCGLAYLLLLVCLGIDFGFRAFALTTGGQFIDVFCLSAAILLQQRHVRRLLTQQMIERERDIQALAASEQAAEELRHQSKATVLQSATASHDLLQLLAAMRLQLATQDEKDPIIHQLTDTLSHADTMLRNRLQLNRNTYRQLQETLSGASLLEEVAAPHRPAFAAKNMRLRVRGAHVEVTCLRLLVRRILDNLLHNALRHAGRGQVLLSGRAHKGGYLIQVWDQGSGIAEARLRQLSRPFAESADPDNGFGLGIHIVQTLCREAGYTFSIRSQPGRGTCCRLWLPPSDLNNGR
jgi:signal transduction histidine kinase